MNISLRTALIIVFVVIPAIFAIAFFIAERSPAFGLAFAVSSIVALRAFLAELSRMKY